MKLLTKFLLGMAICVAIITLAESLNTSRMGLEGRFYATPDWTGEAVAVQRDAAPELRGDQGKNIAGVPVYSVTWTGWIMLDRAGTYRFSTNSDDGSALWIDGQLVVENSGMHGMFKVDSEIALEKGAHEIEIRYAQYGGFSVMQTFFTPPRSDSEQRMTKNLFYAKRPGLLEIMLWKISSARSLINSIGMLGLAFLLGWQIIRVARLQRQHAKMELVGVVCMMGVVFCVTYFSTVKHTASDPLGTLLTAQALLQHGAIKLDRYANELDYERGWQIYEHPNGHLYYYYPPGTPLFSLPAVWIANLFGYNMARQEDDAALQIFLSALTSSLAYLLLYLLCRCYVGVGESIAFAAAFFFSTSLGSTMGSALWNMNLTVIFILLSLRQLVYDAERLRPLHPYWLGVFLFCAYLCRPTASIFIASVLLYLLIMRRECFVRVAMPAGLLLGLFMVISLLEYHQILPRYYLPEHQLHLGKSQFGVGLYGVLFSPGRGVFIYNPVFLLTLLGIILFIKPLVKESLFWLASGWFVLHTIMVARFPVWNGGGSFGSRLFTDVVPSCILFTLLLWKNLAEHDALWRRRAIVLGASLAAFGMFINTYQGLNNWATAEWNADPHIVEHPEIVFLWKYPQFLASSRQLTARSLHYQRQRLQAYQIGQKLFPESSCAIFVSWFGVEYSSEGRAFRWSKGANAEVLFRLKPFQAKPMMMLELTVGAYLRPQTLNVHLNGQFIGVCEVTSFDPQKCSFSFEAALLHPSNSSQENHLTFEISKPLDISNAPRGVYWREIGISFWRLKFYETP